MLPRASSLFVAVPALLMLKLGREAFSSGDDHSEEDGADADADADPSIT